MDAKLVCVDAVATTSEIRLEKLPVVIGRSPEADATISDCWASRFHCRVDVRDGVLVVSDLGSSNGTLVNGTPIQTARLQPGDRLTVGISTFQAVYSPESVNSKTSALHALPFD
jgi:pSer/pThr/pTyr-binding forkhead associated (FHA) protein